MLKLPHIRTVNCRVTSNVAGSRSTRVDEPFDMMRLP